MLWLKFHLSEYINILHIAGLSSGYGIDLEREIPKFSQLALLPQFEKLSHLKTTQVFNSPILMPSTLSSKVRREVTSCSLFTRLCVVRTKMTLFLIWKKYIYTYESLISWIWMIHTTQKKWQNPTNLYY